VISCALVHVTGHFTSKVVFQGAFISALECLQKGSTKITKNLVFAHAMAKSYVWAPNRMQVPFVVTVHMLF